MLTIRHQSGVNIKGFSIKSIALDVIVVIRRIDFIEFRWLNNTLACTISEIKLT